MVALIFIILEDEERKRQEQAKIEEQKRLEQEKLKKEGMFLKNLTIIMLHCRSRKIETCS